MISSLRRWWSMIIRRDTAANIFGDATMCGIWVSTMMRSAFGPGVMSSSSFSWMKRDLYSGLSDKRSVNLSMPSFISESTIFTGFFEWSASRAIPIAAPSASKSSFLWPMMKISSEASICSRREWATTRTLTRVCFSTAGALPPKNCVLPSMETAAWSPPRASASSSVFSA